MDIGIDIGGTYTDGVVMQDNEVISYAKIPTGQDITVSIRQVLEQIVSGINKKKVDRLVLSTTLITNLLAQERKFPVGLILLPGPGVNPRTLRIKGKSIIIRGAIDYRGRIIETLDEQEVKKAVEQLLLEGIEYIGVACKFCQRNPLLEEEIVKIIKEDYPQIKCLASNQVHGLLNWVRRANGTVYQLMVATEYQFFIDQINKTLEQYDLTCPVFILKADGGTIPLGISAQHPLEGIFSGPTASMLGGLAAGGEDLTTVVMDIGGTTTDLGLILKGVPLQAAKGAIINTYPIPSRALAVSSLALGGDTSLNITNKKVCLGKRLGCAYCLGGPHLTITDALVYLGLSEIGDISLAKAKMESWAYQHDLVPQKLAEEALELFLDALEEKLENIFRQWEEEPAYRVWQLLSAKVDRPRTIVCIGGPAKDLGELWGEKKGWNVVIPQYASVANAIGTALAKTTLRLDFFADTQQKIYSTNIGGVHGRVTNISKLEGARDFSKHLFQEIRQKWNIIDEEVEIIYEEGFNIIRGWETAGKIFQIGLQTPPGLKGYMSKGGEI
ncbi:MAG: hydantoinase [Firmicutes bacterium HGW-Firmicutes-12]|jgi:N-methylhydantoinase A/oxoprolinase/acetone carboxylase beta subunit|nr:MAG: hydantoinase [Firmicutes bacterium HGW-Firmicutes-12]